jgi:hypothetical protein
MRKLISKIKAFIARLFIRNAVKQSVCCAACKNEAIKILIDTPFCVAVCENHLEIGKTEIKNARVRAYIKLGCTEDKAKQLAG